MTKQDKSKLRTFFHIIFFIMSPFFPANNFLEVMLMTAIANWLGIIFPVLEGNIMLSSYIYWFYNAVAIVGLMFTDGDKYKISLRMLVSLIGFSIILVLCAFLPDNISYAILLVVSIWYIIKKIKTHICN